MWIRGVAYQAVLAAGSAMNLDWHDPPLRLSRRSPVYLSIAGFIVASAWAAEQLTLETTMTRR